MPICIAGMHRTGSSMVARMLSICGLYLGEEADLHEAQSDNPEGFFEHKAFQDINDRILKLFGGAWDAPPELPANWLEDARLAPIKQEAAGLIAEFNKHPHWGWKDPRSSLVLDFWRELVPNLTVLVTVRNPIDVAASLGKRGYASQTFAFNLTLAYLRATETGSSAHTHYASYFADPANEINRVTKLIGLRPTQEQIAEAAATVSGGLRHSESTILDLFDSDAGSDLVALYLDQCMGCGPTYRQIMRSEAKTVAAFEKEKAERERSLKLTRLERLLNEREREVAGYQKRLVDAERRAGELQRQANDQAALIQHLAPAQAELDAIRSNPTWPFALRMGRSKFWRGIGRVVGKVKREGIGGLFKAIGRRVGGGQTPAPPLKQSEPAEPAPEVHEEPGVIEALHLDPAPITVQTLEAKLKDALNDRPFALAISHDSFVAFTGGIQTLINDERTTLNKEGFAQIHLCPLDRIDRLAEDSQGLRIIVSVDANPLGVGDAQDVIQALSSVSKCVSIQLHHTMNWSLDTLDRILQAFPDAAKFFWLHDYYTACESYNLLRNDRAFCNAPPLDSNSCSICRYGITRPHHLAAFRQFLTKWQFEFLAPSEVAKNVWLNAYPEMAGRVKVTPIYHLSLTGQKNPRTTPNGRKLKIAFPGISYTFKGWLNWRKLVDVLQSNPDYELIHLGQRTGEIRFQRNPERFRRVRSGPQNPRALPETFLEEQIDIIFYCPIWPETFSLIAYEANATGCWTVTTKDSGNVAACTEAEQSGKVFPTLDALVAYLLDAQRVRSDLEAFAARVPILSELAYEEDIVRKLYLSRAAVEC